MGHNDRRDKPGLEMDGAALADCAFRAGNALGRLADLATAGPDVIPAEIDTVSAQHAVAASAFPQVASQLGRNLVLSRDTHQLVTNHRL